MKVQVLRFRSYFLDSRNGSKISKSVMSQGAPVPLVTLSTYLRNITEDTFPKGV
jgi:hypothetical protein